MIKEQYITDIDSLELKLFYNWIDELELRSRLTCLVKEIKSSRKETQSEISKWTGISLTKVKEIENGSCRDFNAINNYINYFGKTFYT